MTQRVAVVLAAGGGSRYQGATHKLLAPFRGRPVVSWVLEQALAARLDQTWVVTGAVDLVAAGAVPPGVEVLANPRWSEGQATSLQVALRRARATTGAAGEIASLVIGLGDQPLLSAAAWRAVAEAPGHPIAVASYGGRRRHPVRINRECWGLLPCDGDEGARVLMGARPELVMDVALEGAGEPLDIDTVADLEQAEAGAPSMIDDPGTHG